MYDYFEAKDAIYSIFDDKHYKHLKIWDTNPSLKYYKCEVSLREYIKAYRKNQG